MLRRILEGLLLAAVVYLGAAVAGYFLILQLSTNVHDRELEAAMTGAFVCGPLGAVVAFVVGVVRPR